MHFNNPVSMQYAIGNIHIVYAEQINKKFSTDKSYKISRKPSSQKQHKPLYDLLDSF